MDEQILRQAGVDPSDMRQAYVDDFALRIGERAGLAQSPGARSWGMLASLSHAELALLYGAEGLEAYRPEAVLAHVNSGEAVAALCYNLDREPGVDERNPEYAARLRGVLENLKFSKKYIDSVE